MQEGVCVGIGIRNWGGADLSAASFFVIKFYVCNFEKLKKMNDRAGDWNKCLLSWEEESYLVAGSRYCDFR
jgi:hypothetical protein